MIDHIGFSIEMSVDITQKSNKLKTISEQAIILKYRVIVFRVIGTKAALIFQLSHQMFEIKLKLG